MNSLKWEIHGEQRFAAVVFRGDAAAPNRLWVCVRGVEVSPESAWSACWSSIDEMSEPELRQFLRSVDAAVARFGRSGPVGPYLAEHLFFEGWDAWGNGIPAPLADLVPADVVAAADNGEIGEISRRLHQRTYE